MSIDTRITIATNDRINYMVKKLTAYYQESSSAVIRRAIENLYNSKNTNEENPKNEN